MLKVLPLLCLLAVCNCQNSNDDDIDAIIEQIFGTTPKPIAQPNGKEETRDKREDDDDLKCLNEGKEGKCVPYYLCDTKPVETDGKGIIDIAFNDSPCVSYIDVCCDTENTLPSVPPATTKETAKP